MQKIFVLEIVVRLLQTRRQVSAYGPALDGFSYKGVRCIQNMPKTVGKPPKYNPPRNLFLPTSMTPSIVHPSFQPSTYPFIHKSTTHFILTQL